MNLLEDLVTQASQLTVYDITKAYTQAKNIVLNVSESEAKVNEATNDEPWGASSKLMLEIAGMTFNFQQFNEIMPCIYSRFMDKEAKQWRQIYKALQLLEYIVKHGSERVVDDARSHVSTVKMLRNFHYVDEKGKDQGINVRNRSMEIASLLGDMDRIRQERKKAKQGKSKYSGLSSEQVMGGSRSYSDRGGSSSYSGDTMGRAGSSYSGHSGAGAATSRQSFDEYDAGDDEDIPVAETLRRPSGSTLAKASPGKARVISNSRAQASVPPVKKEIDLFSFDDDEEPVKPAVRALPSVSIVNPISSARSDDFDDFDDFVAAPSATPSASNNPRQSMTSIYNPQIKASTQVNNMPAMTSTIAPKPVINNPGIIKTASAPKPAAASGFDDLFSFAASSETKPAAKANVSMASLATANTRAQIWGSGSSLQQPQKLPSNNKTQSNNLDDLLL